MMMHDTPMVDLMDYSDDDDDDDDCDNIGKEEHVGDDTNTACGGKMEI